MRIAVVTEYYPDRERHGSGVYVHTRARAYAAAGHTVRVFRVDVGSPRSYDYEGVPVSIAPPAKALASLKGFDPSVLAVHTPYPGALHTRLAGGSPAPRVAWIHGYEAMFTALHGYHKGLHRLTSLIYDARKLWRLRRWLREAASVVFVSNWMRRTAESSMLYRHPNAHVIPNPVDTERFRPAPDVDGDGPMRGLALRNLGSKYGLDLAVQAFERFSGSELTIVGTGLEAERLRLKIARLEAPIRLEERAIPHAQIPELMNAHSYFLAPSRTEAQGVAMCEAMACGLPVVATRAGGIPEFVRDGVDGFLVDRGDARGLREAVARLVSDPARARQMGKRARERIQEVCSADSVIERELAVLAEASAS